MFRTGNYMRPTIALFNAGLPLPWWATDSATDSDTVIMFNCADNAATTVVTDETSTYNAVASTNTNNIDDAGYFGSGGFYLNDTYHLTNSQAGLGTEISNAINAEFTICCWLGSDTANWSDKGNQYFFFYDVDANNFLTWSYATTGNRYVLAYKGGGSTVTAYGGSGEGVDTTDWIFAGATIDDVADEMKLFYGTQSGALYQTGSTVTSLPSMVGSSTGINWFNLSGGSKWDGKVSKIIIKNAVVLG